jgi:hypothetical protein
MNLWYKWTKLEFIQCLLDQNSTCARKIGYRLHEPCSEIMNETQSIPKAIKYKWTKSNKKFIYSDVNHKDVSVLLKTSISFLLSFHVFNFDVVWHHKYINTFLCWSKMFSTRSHTTLINYHISVAIGIFIFASFPATLSYVWKRNNQLATALPYRRLSYTKWMF